MDILLALLLGAFVLVYVPVAVILKLMIVANLLLTLAVVRIVATESIWTRIFRFAAVGALAVILSAALLFYERPSAGLYVFVLLLVTAVYGAVLFRGSIRAVLVSAAAILGSLALIEAHASDLFPWQGSVGGTRYVFDGTRWHEDDTPDSVSSPDLGYVNRPNLKTRQVRTIHGRQVYDAISTVDTKGDRVTGFEHQRAAISIVFLGDSFTFGQGVSDQESLAAVVGREMNTTDVSIHNLGVIGWGIHQVVALLDLGFIEEKVGRSKIQFGVYIGIYDHVRRAMGLAPWVGGGPRYVLAKDGQEAVRYGQFGQGIEGQTLNVLKRFWMFNRYVAPLLVGRKELDLYTALVAKAASEFKQRYGGELLVLYWPVPATRSFDQDIIGRLKERGVRVLSIDAIIPEFWADVDRYHFVDDEHPTPLAYAKVGAFLAKEFSSQIRPQ